MLQSYSFQPSDFEDVRQFFIRLNAADRKSMNWTWVRWEWMYFHPYFNRSLMDSIHLWKVGGEIVGIATYDQYFGEAFCGALPSHRYLLPEIVDYAVGHLRDENGLGIPANDEDADCIGLLQSMGFQKAGQDDTIMRIPLDQPLSYTLPKGFSIHEIRLPSDRLAYKMMIWKGFDHEGDMQELQMMLDQTDDQPVHLNPQLCLAIANESGEFVAHCGCWYDAQTDYACIEPVCTIPSSRKLGLGRAVVSEALNRSRALGAKEAFVGSNQVFYERLGFSSFTHFTYYWKK